MYSSISSVSGLDFYDKCWIKKEHICQVISKKDTLLSTFAKRNVVTYLLNKAVSSIDLFITLAKSFVLKSWVIDTIDCLGANFGKDVLILKTEDLNSETLATYFQELNFNIIQYYEETYPVQSQYSIDFESETETSNKGKQKLKQYSKTTPNIPILPKITAKHLQTPEQETRSKLPLIITPFLVLLAQAQTLNSLLNRFARPKDFTLLRSFTRQQEPLQTSSNLLDFLAENQSEHFETAANEENDSKITKKESIDSKNKENEMTAYITKIPEFNGENIETSLQEWLNQVTKAGDANRWNAARMLRTISYFLKETAGEWFENLATPFND
ncbi:hypothetical protein G9A89_009814 [Geosiphon pyriformis]|nr:hypothetical protein G9A89_009814 [Geosiphon pyriformis]